MINRDPSRKKVISQSCRLSKSNFEQLQSLLFGIGRRDKCLSDLPVAEDVLELKYVISLLKEYTLDFSVADVMHLYKNNKMLFMPLVYLRKMIQRARRGNKEGEVQSYSALLRKLRGYCPEKVLMDMTMMDADWFEGFKTYLQDTGCSDDEISDHMELLWRVYADMCKMNGAKVLFSPEGAVRRNFPEKAFSHLINRGEVERLLALQIKDEGLAAARNLLLLKHHMPEIAFTDLIELKQEDVHKDGAWYRRREDNKLCFVALSSDVIRMIRERTDDGYNLLFRSPFDDMTDECKRLELKLEYYKEQLEILFKIHP